MVCRNSHDEEADLLTYSVLACRSVHCCCAVLQIDDPSVFPGQFGEPFPPNFMEVVRTIFKRLFRVYAHIYHSHFKQVCSLGEEAHLNTCFKHFIFFVRVSRLVVAGAACRLLCLVLVCKVCQPRQGGRGDHQADWLTSQALFSTACVCCANLKTIFKAVTVAGADWGLGC